MSSRIKWPSRGPSSKRQRNIEVPDEKCFVGFDSYQKVLDAGVDIVLLCTPPHFRPAHVEAAVNAGKHIFMEKPCAVDPVGARSILVSSKKAEQLGLSIDSGTIRRVQKDYVETHRRVAAGEIGEIVSAHVVPERRCALGEKEDPGGPTWSTCFATG